jgi:N-acetylneuraminate synthase
VVKKFFSIENRKISKNHNPLIIPEIGINHNGKIDVAFKMVDAAKRAGAEIVKHQTHIPEEEMSLEAKKIKPGNSNKNIYSIIEKSTLSEEDEYKLFKYVQKKNMIFLSSPFSKKAVDRLNKFGVSSFKIGSGEFNNIHLLDYITRFKKNIVLSTGMHDLKTVIKIYKFLIKKKSNFCFLHTTSLYPTPDYLVRLNAIQEMKDNFKNIEIGYSDHTLGITACLSAISLGANIIEKHFTDTKKRSGPDIICSMDEKELKKIINESKRIFDFKKGGKNFLRSEQVTRDFAFASVVSIKNIKKNEKFDKSNLWVKRPGTGDFKLDQLKKLFRKKAKSNISKNTQIKKHHVY